MIERVLFISQIVVSVLLITSILFQQRGTALGSAFGGGGGESYAKRRGLQKRVFQASIVLASLFILIGILNLIF